jgi:hypothetical protein
MPRTLESWYARRPLLVRTALGGAGGTGLFYLLLNVPDLLPTLGGAPRALSDLFESALLFGAMGGVAGGVYGVLWPRLARLGRLGNSLAVGISAAAAFLALLGYLAALRDSVLLREPRFWLLTVGIGFGCGLLLGTFWRGARLGSGARAG